MNEYIILLCKKNILGIYFGEKGKWKAKGMKSAVSEDEINSKYCLSSFCPLRIKLFQSNLFCFLNKVFITTFTLFYDPETHF